MKKRLLLFWILLSVGIQGFGQNRTIDGSGNNIQNSDWGAAHHEIRSITSNGFTDGISSPAGTDRPNPRIISNAVFAQDSLINDVLELSDFTWVFGQFIDHDIVLTPNDPDEDASIPVNFVDPQFNPGGAFPFIEIHMNRSLERPGTGTSTSNPRRYTNEITSWLDASNVYGSSTERANYLRTFVDGKLKTSAGNLLPFNTDNHEYDGVLDPNAPFMDNENAFNDIFFVAGDARANENVALTAVHTIFVLEHNRLCDELIIAHPTWSDEEIYQYARKIVGGYVQSIVYNEWLPAMGVHLDPYSGYDDELDATVTSIFSVAAFRLGHTLLSGVVPRKDNDGNTLPEGNLTLLEAFFAPYEIVENGGIDPIFKGMATQIQQKLDCKIVSDVRNFLFGPPQAGLGGLDLASININRGRERGLADFNTIRQDLGLTPFNSFSEINSGDEVMTILENLYTDVNDIDPWVGMLAEEHMEDALFGETIMKIMKDQFFALREGDRFFYKNDPVLSEVEKTEIENTTFRDIIMRNTGISLMQMNVFKAMDHDSICPASGPLANIGGTVQTFDGDLVENVEINVTYQENGTSVGEFITNQSGGFEADDLETCDHYIVEAAKNDNHSNGVSTIDIIYMQRHILDFELFDNPYKYLSGDANDDGIISTIDVVEVRKVILFLQDTFTNNSSWRFIDDEIEFADPNNPIEAVLDQTQINYLPGDTDVRFIGLKIGDVTGNANPSGVTGEIDTRNLSDVFTIKAVDQQLEVGKNYSVNILTEDFINLSGLQFTLGFDKEAIVINDIIPGNLNNIDPSNFALHQSENAVVVSWSTLEEASGNLFFTVNFTAQTAGFLSDFISMNSAITAKEAYTSDLEIMDVELEFEDIAANQNNAFEVYQNQPNPFDTETTIRFNLPESDHVQLVVYDLSGKMLYAENQEFAAGVNTILLNNGKINGTGILYYQINSSFGSVTKKMIIQN